MASSIAGDAYFNFLVSEQMNISPYMVKGLNKPYFERRFSMRKSLRLLFRHQCVTGGSDYVYYDLPVAP